MSSVVNLILWKSEPVLILFKFENGKFCGFLSCWEMSSVFVDCNISKNAILWKVDIITSHKVFSWKLELSPENLPKFQAN